MIAIRGRCALLTALLLFVIPSLGCTGVFFHPSAQLPITPADAGLRFEDVNFTANDGTALHGWWLPATNPRGTVVFAHGNAANIANHLPSVYWLPAAGYNVFTFDYRGYGRSLGEPSVSGLIADLSAAVNWAGEREGVNSKRIAVLGQSLGGAIAAVYLAEQPVEKRRVRAIVIDSAFASYRAIAQEKLGQFWLSWPLQIPLSYLVTGSYNPVDYISAVSPTPLLLLHSTGDEVVSFSHALQLFERAREPKKLLSLEGGSHIEALHHPEFREALVRFLEENL